MSRMVNFGNCMRGCAFELLGELVRHGRVRRAYIGIAGQQFAVSRRLRHTAGLAQDSAVMVATVEPGSDGTL